MYQVEVQYEEGREVIDVKADNTVDALIEAAKIVKATQRRTSVYRRVKAMMTIWRAKS